MAGGKDNKTKDAGKVKRGPSGFVKSYLIGYNVVESLGWSYILYQLIEFYMHPSPKSLYETVKCSLFIFQNAAVLEIIHAAIRIVPSNPIITAVQVASRVIVVCGILMATQAARETIGLPLALTAWSVTEIIRYANYALNLMGMVPSFITWLRYSTFIVLYPLGITGELLCIYAAQGEVAKTKIFTVELPNSLNFSFDYRLALWILMFLYIPLFPQLYMHMFALRRKVLGSPRPKKD